MHFNHRCTDVDLDSATAYFIDLLPTASFKWRRRRDRRRRRVLRRPPGDAERMPNFEYDESYSLTVIRSSRFRPRGVADGEWKRKRSTWPRKSFMMIALPNPDGSFPAPSWNSKVRAASRRPQSMTRSAASRDGISDAVPLIPRCWKIYGENPTGSLVTIRCAPALQRQVRTRRRCRPRRRAFLWSGHERRL